MASNTEPKVLIGVRQIAERFRIGPHQVQCAIGGLPYFSYGKAKLYLLEDVEKAIQAWRAALPERLAEARVKALETYKKTIAARKPRSASRSKPAWHAITVKKQ